MEDDIMVCVGKIIASAACFGSSSVSEGQPNSAATAMDTNVVLSMQRADDDDGKEVEGEGERVKGYCSKKMKEIVECRICQEEDDFLSLEAPCACSGTLKFAHRKCIQRWCNKKGDITCEICKQDFSPNYSLPPTRSNPDFLAIDIRQAWSPHIDLHDSHLLVLTASQSQLLQSDYEDYVAANSGSLACLRLVALILLIILLLRQVLMLTRDSGMRPDSSTLINFQVLLLQFAGFLLPCYVVARTCYLQSRRRRQLGGPMKAAIGSESRNRLCSINFLAAPWVLLTHQREMEEESPHILYYVISRIRF
ncbi:hypothetical protein V6N13_133397 [Hibiscus sabdariffa]